jgi:excinuclease ABC subunit C
MRHFCFSETWAIPSETMASFIRQYYEDAAFIPRQIFVSDSVAPTEILEAWLSELKGRAVKIHRPQRGEKAKLLKLALVNAEKELKNQTNTDILALDMLARLQRRLRMEKQPNRIECFDNSNISGTVPVAARVVFTRGKPDKAEYRKYKIKTVTGADDYTTMHEVLARRFREKGGADPLPDLLMVDGGKGQLNIAVSVIQALGLENAFSIIGLAKKDTKKGETEDKVYQPGRANPVQFGRDGDLLLFLQRIRDEAHRAAISFHRTRRKKAALQSGLDGIPGIGPRRKRTLLKHFKTMANIRAATIDDLAALPGMHRAAAAALKSRLNEGDTPADAG